MRVASCIRLFLACLPSRSSGAFILLVFRPILLFWSGHVHPSGLFIRAVARSGLPFERVVRKPLCWNCFDWGSLVLARVRWLLGASCSFEGMIAWSSAGGLRRRSDPKIDGNNRSGR